MSAEEVLEILLLVLEVHRWDVAKPHVRRFLCVRMHMVMIRVAKSRGKGRRDRCFSGSVACVQGPCVVKCTKMGLCLRILSLRGRILRRGAALLQQLCAWWPCVDLVHVCFAALHADAVR